MYPDLTPGKHLVLDHHTVADTYRLKRRVHRPTRDPVASVLCADRPWEGESLNVFNVHFNPDTGRHRMWYGIGKPAIARQRRALKSGLAGNIGAPQPYYLCYAESDDGIHWDKPALGIYEDDAGPNNICFKGHSAAGGCGILHRPDAPANERYVLANLDWLSLTTGGVCLAYSADGIHWAYKEPNGPIVFGESDTFNNIVYDPARGMYVVYLRGWHAAAVDWIIDWVGGSGRRMVRKPQAGDDPTASGKGQRADFIAQHGRIKNQRRRVAASQSPDLVNWTEPKIILTPDELDTNDFYGLAVFPYADYFLGQLWVYDDDETETSNIELAFSRDALNWSRLPDRPKFIPIGQPGDVDGFMVRSAQAPVIVGDDIYVYWTGHERPHDDDSWIDPIPDDYIEGRPPAVLRGKLRMDGFISLSADRRLGALITQPFTLQSNRILINAATYGGEITAELVEPYALEPRGKPIEGFEAKDCDVFRADNIHHPLSWNGNHDLTTLRGRRVMLRMSMYQADLYSITL
ncbi:MAG: hypothetical protein CMJ49_00500 [Planctomycetaceae bacterium]|nr:hypothetical protein [Planctomycetaceae bacterium]